MAGQTRIVMKPCMELMDKGSAVTSFLLTIHFLVISIILKTFWNTCNLSHSKVAKSKKRYFHYGNGDSLYMTV